MQERQDPRKIYNHTDLWFKSGAYYIRSKDNQQLKGDRNRLLKEYLQHLENCQNAEQLSLSYDERNNNWYELTARKIFPETWASIGIHSTKSTAYALRLVELLTNQKIDPTKPLPRWIGEWFMN